MSTKKFRLSGFDAAAPEPVQTQTAWIVTGEGRPFPLHVRALDGERESRLTWPGDLPLGQMGLARDGRLAAAIVNRSGATSLWLNGLSAEEPQWVHDSGRSAVYLPRPSPGGGALAYLETPGHGYPPRRDANARIVVLRRTDHGWERQALEADCLLSPWDWGSDDSSLVVTAADGALVSIRSADGTQSAVIAARGTHPRYSPDGETLAYIAADELSLAGSGPTRTLGPVTNCRGLAWTPDGAGVVIAQELGAWNVAISYRPLDGSAERELFSRPGIGTLDVLPAKPGWPGDGKAGE